jgi:hypothetical protein
MATAAPGQPDICENLASGRGGLNGGNCFSYALAIATDHKLLFNGDEFQPYRCPPGAAGRAR